MSDEKATKKIWNRERTRALLRYGRKQSGPWDCDPGDSPEWLEGDIPDDGDLELVLAAPEMLETLKRIREHLNYQYSPFVYRVNFSYIDDAIEKATNERQRPDA